MPRQPDPELTLAVLDPGDRSTVLGWLDLLGMEADELSCVPPLRSMVEVVAVLLVAADMGDDLTREDRFNEAAGALGLNGRTILRRWYRWQEAAVRQNVRRDEDAA